MATDIVACPGCTRRNRVPAGGTGKPRCGQCQAWLPWIVDAGDADYAAVVEKSPVPVLVDFWAPWCGPCRSMAPAFAQAARQLKGRALLVKVDTEANPQLAARFGIRSIPTMVRFEGGREAARQSGALPAGAIVALAQPR